MKTVATVDLAVAVGAVVPSVAMTTVVASTAAVGAVVIRVVVSPRLAALTKALLSRVSNSLAPAVLKTVVLPTSVAAHLMASVVVKTLATASRMGPLVAMALGMAALAGMNTTAVANVQGGQGARRVVAGLQAHAAHRVEPEQGLI
jgi:hypothetical protein